MTEAQKYQKRKNILIISFLILLVAFVCLICYIIIYSKNNPLMDFIDPAEIEIKQMKTADYVSENNRQYSIMKTSSEFKINENGESLDLKLGDDGIIKVVRGKEETPVEILLNETNINNNIKMITQNENISLILTKNGELYKLINTVLEDEQLKVGQILSSMSIKDFIYLGVESDSIFAINSEDKIINTETLKEYNGIIKELQTETTKIYIYDDHSFGTEEGKIFINENNEILELQVSFDNKVVTRDNTVYEINASDGSLSTSSIGTFITVGYRKNKDEDTYKVTILSNTGSYDFNSSYYYTR